jgi:hypothetical protein
MFAESATKLVRAYIHKIKIGPREFEKGFEDGDEPWRSDKAEIRYSPFDPVRTPGPGIAPILKPVPPFQPPVRRVGPTIDTFHALTALVQLRMTSKSGGEYIALAEIAGQAVPLRVGEQLDREGKYLPSDVVIVVEEISMNSVVFRSGNERIVIPFAGVRGTEERPFEIEVIK